MYKINKIMKITNSFTPILLFFLISNTLCAQVNTPKKSVDVDAFWKQDSTLNNNSNLNSPPATPDLFSTENPKVKSLYDSSLMAYYSFSIAQFHRANKVLAWQSTSGKIIFWVVLAIVLAGLILSAIQFYIATKSKSDLPASEIKLSYKEIHIHSSVLGLLILTISIAFFYLYLNYVYPISLLH